jgi:peroxiredoxin Q/BCP
MNFITQSIATLTLIISGATVSLEVGDEAPDFSLQGSDGNTYSLEQFKGKQAIVIAWYPKAFTHGCTIECKSLAENGHLLKKFDVSYFMASVDSLEKNTSFAEATRLTFHF